MFILDPTCDRLAKFLKDWLNQHLKEIAPDQIACRDTICYDAVNLDLSRFPLVKVYRLADNFGDGHPKCETSFVIAYCLTFPSQDQLPGMMNWASWRIAEALSYWKQNSSCPPHIQQGGIRSEYRIMANEVGQPVYAFLRVNFTATDYLED